jgi:hypothetical protein
MVSFWNVRIANHTLFHPVLTSPFHLIPTIAITISAEWTVFSLRTGKDMTTLTRIRSARIAGTEGSMGTLLQGDCAVIPQHGGNLVVWNYMTDEWAQMVDEFVEDDRTVTVSNFRVASYQFGRSGFFFT